MQAPTTVRIGELVDASRISAFQVMVLVLCFLVVLIDGFDTAVIGYVAPALRQEWHLQPAQLAPAFGAGLFGMMVGSLLFGPIADRFGRRRVMLVSLAVMGVAMLVSTAAASIGELSAMRFVTGLGVGGAMPMCITIGSEFAPARKRMLLVTLSYSGFTTGLALGGALAAQIVPAWGWRGVFAVGGAVPLLLLPVMAGWLPESIRFLAARPERAADLQRILTKITGRTDWRGTTIVPDPAPATASTPVGGLFAHGFALRTLLLWTAFFCSLFVFYLLTSWLPTILKDLGYTVATGSRIAAMVALGGTFGAVLLALAMDKVGAHRVLAPAYFLSALALAGVGAALGDALWLAILVFMVGFGVAGAQNGLNLLAATVYPTGSRATGVSWALAAGRVGSIVGSMTGGWLMASAGGPADFFQWIAAPLLAGALALVGMRIVSRPPAELRAPAPVRGSH